MLLLSRYMPQIALVSGLLGLLLMGLRFMGVVYFNEPSLATAAGAEEESLLSIWKHYKGEDIYIDPTRIPFTAAYYNRLYYAVYGEFFRLFAFWGDAWLPTFVRFLSLIFALAGGIAAYFLFKNKDRDLIAASLALWLFAGPLMGFWAMAAHPELACLTLETLGLLVFFRYYETSSVKAILGAVFFSLLAWGFKHNHLFLPASLGLFLLWKKDWRGVFLLSLPHILVMGAAFAIGNEYYRNIFLMKEHLVPFYWGQFTGITKNFVSKSLPIIMLLALGFKISSKLNDKERTAIPGLIISLLLVLPMTAKYGSAENYYFTPMLFACLWGSQVLKRLQSPLALSLLSGAWILHALAVLLVISGKAGAISMAHIHASHKVQKQCLEKLEGPIFSSNPYAALPWMSAHYPNFIPAYSYYFQRDAGRVFAHDGIGGLIKEGYFGGLLLSKGTEIWDKAQINLKYRKLDLNCGNYEAWGLDKR